MSVRAVPSVDRFTASSDLDEKLVLTPVSAVTSSVSSRGPTPTPFPSDAVVRKALSSIGEVMPKLGSAASLANTEG